MEPFFKKRNLPLIRESYYSRVSGIESGARFSQNISTRKICGWRAPDSDEHDADTHLAYESCFKRGRFRTMPAHAGIVRATVECILMSRSALLGAAIFLAGILLALNTWAMAHAIYWTYRLSDIPMHILGGFSIGAFSAALFGVSSPFRLIAFFLAVALGWEVFEYIFNVNVIGTGMPYVIDTVSDVANGALGAYAAYWFSRKIVWQSA